MSITGIKSARAKNVGLISEIVIEPGNRKFLLFVGKNGHGKSTAIDIVWQAIGGKPSEPMPIKRGETNAEIELDLGDLFIKRTFRLKPGVQMDERGNYGPDDWDSDLKVLSKPDEYGGRTEYKKPQQVLDGLIAVGAEDPWILDSMDVKEHVGILTRCLNLDFSGIEMARKEAEEDRRDTKKKINELDIKLGGLPTYQNLPEEEVSVRDLSEKLQKAIQHNNSIESGKADLERFDQETQRLNEYHGSTLDEITEIKKRLEVLNAKAAAQMVVLGARAETRMGIATELELLEPVDTSAIETELAEIETTNRNIRSNRAKAEGRVEWNALEAKRAQLETDLENLKVSKKEQISGAIKAANIALPWEIDFDEEQGLFIGGLPLQERSEAERFRVYIALYLAQNPKFRFVPIKNTGCFDEDNMAELPKIAEEQNCIIWAERATKSIEGADFIMKEGQPLELRQGGDA